jgi:hypothetical protein
VGRHQVVEHQGALLFFAQQLVDRLLDAFPLRFFAGPTNTRNWSAYVFTLLRARSCINCCWAVVMAGWARPDRPVSKNGRTIKARIFMGQ